MSEATLRSRRLCSLPHLPRMEDEGRSWEMSCTQRQPRGEMPQRGLTLVLWEGGPTSQNPKAGIRLDFCSGPSLPPSPYFPPPLFLGRAKPIPRWTWRNCLVGSELVHGIRQEMATPQLPPGHPRAARRCFGGCRQGCAADPQFLCLPPRLQTTS